MDSLSISLLPPFSSLVCTMCFISRLDQTLEQFKKMLKNYENYVTLGLQYMLNIEQLLTKILRTGS